LIPKKQKEFQREAEINAFTFFSGKLVENQFGNGCLPTDAVEGVTNSCILVLVARQSWDPNFPATSQVIGMLEGKLCQV
jgi:hypothetical protein